MSLSKPVSDLFGLPSTLLATVVSRVPLLGTLIRLLTSRVKIPVVFAFFLILNWENLPFVYHLRTNYYIFRGIFQYVVLKSMFLYSKESLGLETILESHDGLEGRAIAGLLEQLGLN